jgi:hypothetical protein
LPGKNQHPAVSTEHSAMTKHGVLTITQCPLKRPTNLRPET